MKVRDLFELNSNLKNLKLLAGVGGIDRDIKDVEIMEIPDGIYWINEGDFVVTTAYYLHQNSQDLMEWINILSDKGAAGIGIKTDRFLKKIKSETIARADELDLPLIELPIHIGYSDLTWPIISKIMGEKDFITYRLSRYTEELLSLSAKSFGLADVFRLLKKYMKNPFVFFSEQNDVLECLNDCDKPVKVSRITSIINENRARLCASPDFTYSDGKGERLWFGMLRAEGEIIGYVTVLSEDDYHMEIDQKIVKMSIPFLITSLLLERAYKQLTYGSKEEFIKAVMNEELTSDIKIRRYAGFYNIPFEQRRILWIVEIGWNENLENVVSRVQDIISTKLSATEHEVLVEENRLICISSVREKTFQKKWFEDLSSELHYKFLNCTFDISVSKVFDTFNEIYLAYEESRFGLEAGKMLEEGSVKMFSDLRIYYILNRISSQPEVMRIYEDTIEKLHEYDVTNSTDLVETVAAFIKNNYNVMSTAEALFIHRNTLYKRLRKIDSILGIDTSDSEQNLILSLGLKLHKLLM